MSFQIRRVRSSNNYLFNKVKLYHFSYNPNSRNINVKFNGKYSTLIQPSVENYYNSMSDIINESDVNTTPLNIEDIDELNIKKDNSEVISNNEIINNDKTTKELPIEQPEPNSSLLKDVHTFDTHYDIKILPLKDYTSGEKQREGQRMLERINSLRVKNGNDITIPTHQQYALDGIKFILLNLGQDYDSTNHIDACSLLTFISYHLEILEEKKIDNSHYLLLLVEQLSDMIRTGQCLQGRANRLFQIAKILYEDMKDNLKVL